MKKLIFLILFLFLGLLILGFNYVFAYPVRNDVSNGAQTEKIEVSFFYSTTCSHCAAEKKFLEEIEKKCPQVEFKKFLISEPANFQLYQELGEKHNIPEQLLSVGSVPLTFIGEKPFLGYDTDETTGKEIENYINSLIGGSEEVCQPGQYQKSITFLGREVRISSGTSLISLALIFGLVDGINPCMFAVLLILISYLLGISSFKKAIRAGVVFGVCVFFIYFSLMLAVYKSLCLFQQNLPLWMDSIKTGLGIVLLLMGVWMFKDFFLAREKISFSVPVFAKPIFKKLIHYSTIPAIILLALFSSLVELPCTFILPFSFTAILSERNVSPYFYLILYNFCFVLPLFVIVAIAGLGILKVEKIEEWRKRSRKIMRLIAGISLFLLGIAFLAKIF